MQLTSAWNNLDPTVKRRYNIAIGCIIAAGIFFRLYHFIDNRSLWEDEVYLSAGIVKMTFHDLLTKPLPYLQKAPLGYLLVSRFMVVLFGNNEMALRVYPLLTGIVSLFLFVRVASNLLKPLGVLIALSLLAFASPLIYHAVEAKPYGTEMFATIVIMWFYFRFGRQSEINALLVWAMFGAVLVWFSYTAIFILAAVALAVSMPYLARKDWRMIFRLTPVYFIWVASFGVSYLLYAKEGSDSSWLVDFWKHHEGYIPLAPVGAAEWIVHRVFSLFHYPLGLSWKNDWFVKGAIAQIVQRFAWVPLVLLPLGIFYFYNRARHYLVFTGAVVIIALLASALKMYPFHERLTVYLAPVFIIMLAGGCEMLACQPFATKYAGYGLALLLLVGPVKNSIAQTAQPYLFGDYKKSYQREAMQYVNDHYRAGDAVYVYRTDIPAYWFYKNLLSLKFDARIGSDYRATVNNFNDYFSKVDADIYAAGGNRVWIIDQILDVKVGDFTDVPFWYYRNHDAINRFREHVKTLGKVIDEFKPADGGPNSNVHAMLIELKSGNQ